MVSSFSIAMMGTGYVGLVSGACFADMGYDVTCIDRDAEKIAGLNGGISPLYEPGLEEMLSRNTQAGRLHFTTDAAPVLEKADYVFIAVGTPPSEVDGLPDLSALEQAVAMCARHMRDGALLVVKSTVPCGTTRSVAGRVKAFRGEAIEVASNPEFLRQGNAIKDFMQPDRVVTGVASASAHAAMQALYAPLDAPFFATTYESAEMIKYAANSLLAAKVAFINEMADICEKTGANVLDVASGVGLDKRIGAQFLQPGPGFGGSCFPKDTVALLGIAEQVGVPAPIVHAVVESNRVRRLRMTQKIEQAVGGDVDGKVLAVLGVAFKAGTDDLRESVSLDIVPALLAAGAKLRIYDPQGMKQAQKHFEGDIVYAADAYDACASADAAVVLTEWPEFRELELLQLKTALGQPVMVDLRNIYDRAAMKRAGFTYVSIGRQTVRPDAPSPADFTPLEEGA